LGADARVAVGEAPSCCTRRSGRPIAPCASASAPLDRLVGDSDRLNPDERLGGV